MSIDDVEIYPWAEIEMKFNFDMDFTIKSGRKSSRSIQSLQTGTTFSIIALICSDEMNKQQPCGAKAMPEFWKRISNIKQFDVEPNTEESSMLR